MAVMLIILLILVALLCSKLLIARRRGIEGGGEPSKQTRAKLAHLDQQLAALAAGDDKLSPAEARAKKHALVDKKADLQHHWRITDVEPWSTDPYTGYKWRSKEGWKDRAKRGLVTYAKTVPTVVTLAA